MFSSFSNVAWTCASKFELSGKKIGMDFCKQKLYFESNKNHSGKILSSPDSIMTSAEKVNFSEHFERAVFRMEWAPIFLHGKLYFFSAELIWFKYCTAVNENWITACQRWYFLNQGRFALEFLEILTRVLFNRHFISSVQFDINFKNSPAVLRSSYFDEFETRRPATTGIFFARTQFIWSTFANS